MAAHPGTYDGVFGVLGENLLGRATRRVLTLGSDDVVFVYQTYEYIGCFSRYCYRNCTTILVVDDRLYTIQF